MSLPLLFSAGTGGFRDTPPFPYTVDGLPKNCVLLDQGLPPPQTILASKFTML